MFKEFVTVAWIFKI